jgi:hypothetical protein
MAVSQTIAQKMAPNKACSASQKDLHKSTSGAVLFIFRINQARNMHDFAPVIFIELILVFGGVVLFAWWQFRDLRKEREKRMRLESKPTNSDEGNS